MSGKYKVNIIINDRAPMRRSSHKTQDDARLQSKRDLAKQPADIRVEYQIILNNEVIETVTRDE